MAQSMKRALGIGLLLTSAATISGCVAGAVGAAGAVGVAAIQDRTLGEGLDDATASSELKTRLLAASPQRFNEVDVEVANGLALLSGRVNDPLDRIEAEHIAWTIDRIEDVANEIVVETPGGFSRAAGDEWITARVRARLVADGQIKSVNYNIETYNGRVFLMGIARNVEELKRAAEHASYVGGVKEVVSYVQVRGAGQTRRPVQRPQSPSAPAQPSGTPDLAGGPIY